MNSTFSHDISKFVKKTGLRADLVVRKIALDALRGVMLKSPVDTGRFRANWRVGINRTDLSVDYNAFDKNPGGPPSQENVAAVSTAKFGDRIAITNNLPYGPALERGHSKQAPSGMLRVTLLEIETGLANAVKAL